MSALSHSRRARDEKPAASSVEVVAPEQLQSMPVSLTLAYWNRLRGTRRFPTRAEIAPREMAPFLRNVVLARVLDGGRDYEYRIAGDAYVQAFDVNFKGMLLTQIEATAGDYGRATRAVYEHVRGLGEPFALRGWVAPSSPSHFSYHETVFLPLGDGATVDHLLAATAFTPRVSDTDTEFDAVLPDSWRTSGES